MLLCQHSAQEEQDEVVEEENINDESTLHRESYGRHPHCCEIGGMTGQLALLRDSIFVSLLPPSTLYFEDRAKNYSVLTRNHFIKQVSQTVGRR